MPALAGWVLGTAVQLQQVELFSASVYGLLFISSLVLLALAALKKTTFSGAALCAVLAAGVCAFALTGLRASCFMQDALRADLEGRDIVVTGVVAAMPQRNESGLRFRLDVESARAGAAEVRRRFRQPKPWP
jgi:competence protein ComEC